MSTFLETFGTDDPRLGHIIKPGLDGQIVILGFPHDEGVRRNGGRVGAKDGPSSFRKFLQKIGAVVNPEYNVDLRHIKVTDGGDIDPNCDLETAHVLLREKVAEVIKNGGIPFIVGGGNDQSYPNVSGMFDSTDGSVGIVNIDAHLDVRPLKEGKVHSGSPFRLMLEDERFKSRKGSFAEFAVQGHQCSIEHWDYVQSKENCQIIPLSYLRESKNVEREFLKTLETLGENVFVSFDIDSISSADCPGVSAPGTIGLSSIEACKISYQAGLHKSVKLMDLSEYNPQIEEYRTGRLAVLMFYYFLMGYVCRGTFKIEMDEHFSMGEGHFLS